jgi:hypothetical protein
MADYSKFPKKPKREISPFKCEIPDEQLQKMKQLIELTPIAPKTFENLREDGQYGVTRDWLIKAKKFWTTDYNW